VYPLNKLTLTSLCGCQNEYDIEGLSELDIKKLTNKIESQFCYKQCKEKYENQKSREKSKTRYKKDKGLRDHRKVGGKGQSKRIRF
jgi:hypothetical protein